MERPPMHLLFFVIFIIHHIRKHAVLMGMDGSHLKSRSGDGSVTYPR